MPKFDVLDDELFNPEEQACINKALRDLEGSNFIYKGINYMFERKRKNYF